MNYNYEYRSGKAVFPGGSAFEKYWFTVNGERAALKSRDIDLQIRDINQVGYEIREITAEYFELRAGQASDFTYTANTFT